MKIKCSCNNIIIDTSDYLKHKGYLISDTQWFNFWDAIDNAIEKSGDTKKEKEDACWQLRKQNVFKTVCECTDCGKLYIEGNKKGELIIYEPESKEYIGILNRKDN